jgi:hypothetical protein
MSRRGVTLMEVLVAAAAFTLISGVVMGYLHRLGRSLSAGEHDFTVGQKVNYVLRFVAMRLGSINPPLVRDRRNDLWQVNEDRGLKTPYRVAVLDTDGTSSNGGEVLEYIRTPPEGSLEAKTASLMSLKGNLVEVAGDQAGIICRGVDAVHFQVVAGDPRALRVEVAVRDELGARRGLPLVVTQRVVLRSDSENVIFQQRGDF